MTATEVDCPICARTYRRLAARGRPAPRAPRPAAIGAAAGRAALGGLRLAHGGGTRCPICGAVHAESELEAEFELMVNPVRRIYPDAMMAHIGHAATEAESEAEAEAFIGALVPIAARLIPRAAPVIMRAAPQLVRALSGVTRTLRRSPATRPLVRAIPEVMRRTVAGVADQVARGRPVTPQSAVRLLARNTSQVLGNPQAAVRAYRRTQALDRRYHAATCPHVRAAARPRPAPLPRVRTPR
jgi:hypothetical protein